MAKGGGKDEEEEEGCTMAHEGKVSQYYVFFFSLTKANEAMFMLTNK